MKAVFNIRCDRRILNLNKRPYIMGILNVTPDSFSDGGHYLTINSSVECARRMAEEGADIIDISGLRFDPMMAKIAAEAGCPVIIMHMKGTPRDMQRRPAYKDVVKEITAFFKERIAFAVKNGII